jgi:ParB-like chromosome segregation protein Spo0J
MQADYIKIGPRFRKDLGAIDGLVASIQAVGLIHPVVVDQDGNLVAGERRLAACLRLGWRDVPATIVDLDADVLRIQDDENTMRKNFTPTEAVAIRDARLAHEKAKAKERMESTLKQNAPLGKVSPADKGHSRDKAAKGTGYSGRTVDKAAAVMEAAAADPALEPVVEEMDRTGKVDPAYQKAKGKKSSEAVAKRKKTISEQGEAEFVRGELTRIRTKYKHLAYWQPVWDAIDTLNTHTP